MSIINVLEIACALFYFTSAINSICWPYSSQENPARHSSEKYRVSKKVHNFA